MGQLEESHGFIRADPSVAAVDHGYLAALGQSGPITCSISVAVGGVGCWMLQELSEHERREPWQCTVPLPRC